MSAKTPIRWTDDERASLVSEAARLIHAGEFPVTRKGMALVQAMSAVLPPARRRSSDGLMSGPTRDWFNPAVTRELKRLDRADSEVPAATKIFWTKVEKVMIAHQMALLLHKGISTSRVEALRLAQSVLPVERRRDGLFYIKHLSEMMDPVIDEALAKLRAAEVEPPAPAPHMNGSAILAEPEPAPVEVAEVAEVAPPAPVPALPAIDLSAALSASIGGLRALLVDAMAGVFRDALAQAIGSLAVAAAPPMPHEGVQTPIPGPVMPRHNPNPTSTPRVAKPAVLVAGLKTGAQKSLMLMEFGNALDLRFYISDESKDQLRKLADAADVVVTTEFLSHSHTDIIKGRAKRMIYAGDGITAVRDTLMGLVPTSAQAS